jgi:hypothetical protein
MIILEPETYTRAVIVCHYAAALLSVVVAILLSYRILRRLR